MLGPTCDSKCGMYTAMGEKCETHSIECVERMFPPAPRRPGDRQKMANLLKEAIDLFNDGLNIGLGWVARAERLLGQDE